MNIAALCGTSRQLPADSDALTLWLGECGHRAALRQREALRTRTLTAAARLNHDLTAGEREALADELAAIAMELRA